MRKILSSFSLCHQNLRKKPAPAKINIFVYNRCQFLNVKLTWGTQSANALWILGADKRKAPHFRMACRSFEMSCRELVKSRSGSTCWVDMLMKSKYYYKLLLPEKSDGKCIRHRPRQGVRNDAVQRSGPWREIIFNVSQVVSPILFITKSHWATHTASGVSGTITPIATNHRLCHPVVPLPGSSAVLPHQKNNFAFNSPSPL